MVESGEMWRVVQWRVKSSMHVDAGLQCYLQQDQPAIRSPNVSKVMSIEYAPFLFKMRLI